MASTHVTDADIERFGRRQLGADRLVAFGDHLAGCAACRIRVAAQGDTAAAAAALQEALGIAEDGHVPESEIHAFVDGGVDAERRAAISAHLAECPRCAEDVRDLSDFAATFAHRSRRSFPWVYGTFAAAAVLVLGIAATLFWRSHTALPGAGSEAVAALDPGDAAQVRNALASGRLSLPSTVSELTGRRSALLGAAEGPTFSLTAPVATAVLDPRPTLRWQALSRSATYTVTLQDESTGETISSPPLQRSDWMPEQPLVRGRTYTWQVAASERGKEVVAPRPPEAPARFIVADAAAAARLPQLPAPPLARGILYASAGLLDDAEREFNAVRPGDTGAERVGAFLAQLRQARTAR
ncbi:MAG: hypothetical protein JWL71_1159 [Acidobacteria bacterium]|nr:hypothetical protein [Acidobacteriota bacterium]